MLNRRAIRASRVSLAAMACALIAPAVAEESADEVADPDAEIEQITVIATRTERSLDEIAATVSIKTAEELEREIAHDIADAVRYEPGVSVAGTGSRFGLTGFNIRGIGGNRVLTMVDGIRVPDEFSFGPFLSARRDFVDIDSLSRIEIARGPISSLYGSDALGGVVAYRTKQPGDYLTENESLSGSLRAGYSSADDAYLTTLGLAGRSGPTTGLIFYTRRSGHESENTGSIGGTGTARERPDPLSTDIENLVSKIEFDFLDAHSISISLDLYQNDISSQILSDYGSITFGTSVDSRDAQDRRSRKRWSLGYLFTGGTAFADRVEAVLYQQESKTDQLTQENRTTPRRNGQTRFRDSFFEQQVEGVWIHLLKRFEIGNTSHQLSYGVDYYKTDNASLRNGRTIDSNGRPVREFTIFPTRGFPITEVTQLAVFFQDELTLLDGRLALSPGIRFDGFEARARADEVYLSGNLGTPLPTDFDSQEVTAKLGASWVLNEQVSLYARYAEGFRAPPYDDVNVGFTNFLGGYKTVSNPDLSSESSAGIEVGARFRSHLGSFRFAYFANDYKDFIESFALAPAFLRSGGIDPSDGFRTFQSVNRGEVTIEGWEMRGSLDFAPGWRAQAALAYAKGEDKDRDAPLNTIEPLSTVLGIGYSAPGDRWGLRFLCTLSADKDTSDIDSEDPRFPTDAYSVFDLLGYARFGTRLHLNIGVFNLTDEQYIRWVDTAGIGTDPPTRFSQPGINAAVSLRVEI